MKALNWKKAILTAAVILAVLCAAALASVFALRIDAGEARQLALDAAGGGEIVSQEISSEGLWNEYSYGIVNGDTWYDIEIGGFGTITELESGSGQYRH